MDLPAYAVIGASAADLLTTELALRPGYVEANPLMQDRGTRLVLKTAGTLAILAANKELKRRGHRNWAKGICWGAVAAWGGAALWNLHQAKSR